MMYLDNAATAITDIQPYDNFGNPSTKYSLGMSAKHYIFETRCAVADSIGANQQEIYFTSGGTESNNTVINSFAKQYGENGLILVSAIEHPSVYKTAYLSGCDCFEINVGASGLVSEESLIKALEMPEIPHKLVAIQYVNGEIGTIQNIKRLAEIAHSYGAQFHCDMVQAYGHVFIDVKDLGVDTASFSGHKIGAMKGTGFLYVDERTKLIPLMYGGDQESGMRAGTENVFGIKSINKPASFVKYFPEGRIVASAEKLKNALLKEIPGSKINGSEEIRVQSNINILLPGCDNQEVQAALDILNVIVGTGSACCSGNKEPSRVLKAIGLSDEQANSSIRITLFDPLADAEITDIVNKIKTVCDFVKYKKGN